MKEKYQMLRKKMARFNRWEVENCRDLTSEERLEQYFVLYNLGKLHRESVLARIHEEHLMGLIKTNERLNKVAKGGGFI